LLLCFCMKVNQPGKLTIRMILLQIFKTRIRKANLRKIMYRLFGYKLKKIILFIEQARFSSEHKEQYINKFV
jgi:hypothetical protein